MSAVPILILALTLLLLTPLSSDPSLANAAPIGGIRYYALVGLLPALHWCMEILNGRGHSGRDTALRCGLLAIQIFILWLAILVRGAPAYLLVPVAASAIYSWWRKGDAIARRRTLRYFFIPAVALIAGLVVLPRLAFPEYSDTGRLYGLFWHRAFIGFASNPAWPFPGLRQKYDCTKWFPEGLDAKGNDGNGQCVWLAYRNNPARPLNDVANELYDGAYEAAMRSSFVHVVRTYPREAFDTFVYYKPKALVQVTIDTLQPDWSVAGRPIALLALLQMALCVAFIIARPPPAPLNIAARQAGILVMFMVPALAPQLLAWPAPHTSVDVFAYVLCGCIIFFWLLVSYAFRLVARPDSKIVDH
jgi:hypothetical protein